MTKLVMVIFTFFFMCVNSYALSPSDYTSFFQIPQIRTYCSNNSVNCMLGGQVGSGTCGKGNLADYPYRCTKNMVGFKNLYDFSDPRICLQIDSGASECCDKEHYWISAVAPQEYGGFWGACDELSAFRVFIPPGTTHFNLTLYLSRDDMIGMVARFKEVPECGFCACGGNDEYEDLPISPEYNIVLDDEMARKSSRSKAVLTNQDVYQSNMGGHISITFGFSEAEALTEARSGWLFLKMIPCRDNSIANVRLTIEVNAKKYRQWFSSANWDSNGDPVMEGAVDTPEPVIMPEPVVPDPGISELPECGELPPQVYIGTTDSPVEITKQDPSFFVCIIGGYAQSKKSELFIWREENGKTYYFDGTVWHLTSSDLSKCEPIAVMNELPHHNCFSLNVLSSVAQLKDCMIYVAIDDVIDNHLTPGHYHYGKQEIKIIDAPAPAPLPPSPIPPIPNPIEPVEPPTIEPEPEPEPIPEPDGIVTAHPITYSRVVEIVPNNAFHWLSLAPRRVLYFKFKAEVSKTPDCNSAIGVGNAPSTFDGTLVHVLVKRGSLPTMNDFLLTYGSNLLPPKWIYPDGALNCSEGKWLPEESVSRAPDLFWNYNNGSREELITIREPMDKQQFYIMLYNNSDQPVTGQRLRVYSSEYK